MGAVHHPFEVPSVEFPLRFSLRLNRFALPRLSGIVLFPTIIRFLTAGFGTVLLRPPVAGWLEFLAAEFALHRRFPRFPTFRCFPCFRRLHSGRDIGTAPEATPRGYAGYPAWYRVRCRTF